MNINTENDEKGKSIGRNAIIFDSEKISQVEKLSAILTVEQMADFFDISDNTFRAICKRQSEVIEAYKRGKAKAISITGAQLLSLIDQGNLQAITFYLSRRGGWTEKQSVEVNNTTPVKLPETPEAFRKLRDKVLKEIDV